MKTVADLIWRELRTLGVSHVVGVAGTQTVSLLDALRKSPLRYIATNTELAASFLAGGFYRACGRPAVLLTIPGPGFTFALPGLAEARDDSAGLIYLLPVREDARPFASQQHPHREIGELLAKQVLRIDDPEDTVKVLQQAWEAATGGEPGPVIVIIPVGLLGSQSQVGATDVRSVTSQAGEADTATLAAKVARRIETARLPLLFFGQGAAAAVNDIRELVPKYRWPVITTTSGRGIVPESDPLVLPWECIVPGHLSVIQDVVSESDLIISVGCKLSHNGSAGYGLNLPPEKLVRIDTSEKVLSAGQYPASITGCAPAASFMELLAAELQRRDVRSNWREVQLSQWRTRLKRAREEPAKFQPSLKAGSKRVSMKVFFDRLQEVLDPTDVLVTDSGNHQNLARRCYSVEEPLGLLCPINYQSMGFVLPAAMGARLARPDNRVIALMGDGGFCMFGLELLTVVQHSVDLTVIVFNDQRLSMIADQQATHSGHEYGVDVVPPAMAPFAEAVGASYVKLDKRWTSQLEVAVNSPGVTLVEAVLELPAAVGRRSSITRLVNRTKGLGKGLNGLFKKT